MPVVAQAELQSMLLGPGRVDGRSSLRSGNAPLVWLPADRNRTLSGTCGGAHLPRLEGRFILRGGKEETLGGPSDGLRPQRTPIFLANLRDQS